MIAILAVTQISVFDTVTLNNEPTTDLIVFDCTVAGKHGCNSVVCPDWLLLLRGVHNQVGAGAIRQP
jgi:hypothetical protein